MTFIDNQLAHFKYLLENSIITGGADGKASMIKSSALINLIHDAVKHELIKAWISPQNIYPPFGETKPEIKLAGFIKQKNQDVRVVPSNFQKEPTNITWGPLAFENKVDPYGFDYSTNTLVINVRSQMSSLDKNADTLFERTFAEADNLHMRYPEMVLGEVYLIPVREYDDELVKHNQVGFKRKPTNIEKYINFFSSINGRPTGGPEYAYERCALLVVDFSQQIPYLFQNSAELKAAGYISNSFPNEYANIHFRTFTDDILRIYGERYDLRNLMYQGEIT